MIDGGFGYNDVSLTNVYTPTKNTEYTQNKALTKTDNVFNQRSAVPVLMDSEFDSEINARIEALNLGLDDVEEADFEPIATKPTKEKKALNTTVKTDRVFKTQKKGKSFFAKLGDLFRGVLSGFTALNGRIEMFSGMFRTPLQTI